MSHSPLKSAKSRPRGRSTASIIKAAKEAGCASVTFPDGTVITLAPTEQLADAREGDEKRAVITPG